MALSAGQDLSLTARKGLLKLDGYGGSSPEGASRVSLASRDLNLQGASVDIQGASLSASRDLRITATEGSINIAALQNTVDEGGYSNRYMQAAEISAGRNLQIFSSGDITAQGVKANAGADLRMQAAASLQLTGTSNRTTNYDGFWTTNQRQVNSGRLNAGGSMALSAGTDLLMDAIQARAGGAMTINALGNVRLDASQNWRESTGTRVDSGKWSTTVTHYLRESITTTPTELNAASVSVSAGSDLNTYATRIASSGRTNLQAGGAANYYAVYDQINNRDDSTKTRSFFGIQYSSSSSTSSHAENIPMVTRLQSQAELASNSGGDTLLQGTQVSAGGGYAFNAGVGEKARADARVILEGVKTTVQQSKTSKSDYVVWQSQSGSGSNTQTLALPSFAGGGTLSAPGGLSVQIPDGNFKNQIQTLSQQPGMGYLNDLAARKDVNWQAVKLANDQWNYSQSGLTPAGAALLSVAVAWATGGMGANLVGGTVTTTTATGATITTTTTAGMMANAAFSSLAAQASITLVNNKGDIDKTLKDLSNSSTAKATLAAMLTAGVLDKMGATTTMSELTKSGGFADKLTYNLINATGRALTSTAINGGDLQGALKVAIVGGLVDTAQGQAASLIKGLEGDYLAHKLAHALAGCIAGAAAGGQCKDGAIGAAVGEIVVGMFDGQKPGPAATQEQINAYTQKVLAYSKLVAGAVTAYAGGNAQTAITTAETAVRNNGLLELLYPRNLPKKNFNGRDLSNQVVDKFATIDSDRQRIILIQPGERDLYAAGTGGPQVDGYTVIFAHGNQDSIQGAQPKNLAEWNSLVDMIKNSGAWKPGQPIILDACNTGEIDNGVASALAKSLNVKVIGSNTTTWNIPSYSTSGITGSYQKLSETIPNLLFPGIWKTFGPDGSLLSTTTKKPF